MYYMAGFATADGAREDCGAGARMLAALPRVRGGTRSIFSDEGVTLLHSGQMASDTGHGGRPLCRRIGGRTLTVVLAGWLSNGDELREKLSVPEQVSLCRSDTELALMAYARWGADCPAHLDGAYALAVWDGHTLFLARDQYGLRPLFLARGRSSVVFGSDPTLLRAHPDGITSPGQTTESLPPGHHALWTQGRWEQAPYSTHKTYPAVSAEDPAYTFERLWAVSAGRVAGNPCLFWLENDPSWTGNPDFRALSCGLPACAMAVADGGSALPAGRAAVITGQEAALGLCDLTARSGLSDVTQAESAGHLLCRRAARWGTEALTSAGCGALLEGQDPLCAARILSRAECAAARAGLTLHPVMADPDILDFLSGLSPAQRTRLASRFSFAGDAFPTPCGPEYRHGLHSRLRALLAAGAVVSRPSPDDMSDADAARLVMRGYT